MSKYFFSIYNALWRLALPLLHRNSRLAEGWDERTLQTAPQDTVDIWIQAASGGEAMLVNMVLEELAQTVEGKDLRILTTSTTPQGCKILKEGQSERKKKEIQQIISFSPFDTPTLMERAFLLFRPRLAILVETELWPGFLATASAKKIPVLVINGRMSKKSHRAYRKFSSFFQQITPQKVLAMSQEDGERFADIMGEERVAVIPNLKFDKIAPQPKENDTLKNILPKNAPFLVFGSIRKEEEIQIINCIHQLFGQQPDLVIGLFPKHIERAQQVIKLTAALGIPCVLRSSLTTPAATGSVIVWDCFGELASAYQQAQAAFVGGSLCPKGGHNLVEPLAAGIRPLTGPNWQDFAWLGEEAKELGLIEEVHSGKELTEALMQRLAKLEDREKNKLSAEQYLARHRGGTTATCKEIIKLLPAKNQ